MYKEGNRNVEFCCRKDKRVHTSKLAAQAEAAARQGDMKILY